MGSAQEFVGNAFSPSACRCGSHVGKLL